MIKTNKFRIKTDGNKVLSKQILSSSEPINFPSEILVNVNDNKNKIELKYFKEFESFFNVLYADILLMHTTETNLDKIFNLFERLIENYDSLIKQMTPAHLKKEYSNIFESTKQFVIDKMSKLNTAKKRQKLMESDETYVKPINVGIGLAWKSKGACGGDLVEHKLQQTTYQYVSIIDTLKSLFKNDEFCQNYFDYNSNRKHVCEDGVFEDFCCGSIYKNNSMFDSTVIQLQLAIDEFEPCNALKTKAGLHKMCAVYLEIRNIDPKLKSKLSNIYLVALVKSQDIKSEGSTDKIAKKIVEELKTLESTGIVIRSGVNLKAILVNISSDNLGANSVLGFVESFAATYFCRICELTLNECQSAVEEKKEKMRGKSNYNLALDVLNDNDNPSYKESKGIKRACVFNELQNFHILDNCTVDIMHDMNEGVIPFYIRFLFQHMVEKKITTTSNLQALCRDFDYGSLWKKYKPSAINMDKPKLNQNAMQSYCLMINLPFILIKFRAKLGSAWNAMQDLLQILQILNSTRIYVRDVDRLRDLLKKHLKYLVDMGVSLLPKHHIASHYPNLILKIGPLKHSWMMRFESKHKLFTDLVHLTYNYKNLPFTLAKRHQARICANNSFASFPEMEISKTSYKISKCADFTNYESILVPFNGEERGLRFIRNGMAEYRTGLMVIDGDSVQKILHVISVSQKYYILCKEYTIVQFVDYLNCIEIRENANEFKLLQICELKTPKSYDSIHCDDKIFIIADTFDVFNEF